MSRHRLVHYSVVLLLGAPVAAMPGAHARLAAQDQGEPPSMPDTTAVVARPPATWYWDWALAAGYVSHSFTITAPGVGTRLSSASGLALSGGLDFRVARAWAVGLSVLFPLTGSEYGGSFYLVNATLYPTKRHDAWIKFYLGHASLSTGGSDCLLIPPPYCVPVPPNSTGGLAGGLGVGFDWFPGTRHFHMIPFVNYIQQFESGSFSGLTGVSGSQSLLQIGLGFAKRH